MIDCALSLNYGVGLDGGGVSKISLLLVYFCYNAFFYSPVREREGGGGVLFICCLYMK